MRTLAESSWGLTLISGLLLLSACSQPSGDELTPPEGYRAIAENEYPASWRAVSDRFPNPERAEGDFDGDSEMDRARIWIKEVGDGWVLTAYLSTAPESPIRVRESGAPLAGRFIRTIPPGEHKTHRYYGIGPGGPDTVAVIVLRHDAINLGYRESEGSTFVWNQASQAFDEVAMY